MVLYLNLNFLTINKKQKYNRSVIKNYTSILHYRKVLRTSYNINTLHIYIIDERKYKLDGKEKSIIYI